MIFLLKLPPGVIKRSLCQIEDLHLNKIPTVKLVRSEFFLELKTSIILEGDLFVLNVVVS